MLENHVDYSLDFRGAIAPLAMLKLSRVFREMRPNQTLEVIGLDVDTRSDLFRLLPKVSYDLIAMDESEAALIRVCLRKR